MGEKSVHCVGLLWAYGFLEGPSMGATHEVERLEHQNRVQKGNGGVQEVIKFSSCRQSTEGSVRILCCFA